MGNSYRIRYASAFAAALWLSGSAQAQTTNCTTYGNATQCQTNQGFDPNLPLQVKTFSLSDILNDAQQRQARQQQMDLQARDADVAASDREMARQSANLSQDVREAVGDFLKQGKCEEAVAFALKYGEIELATQAKGFCAAP